AGDGFSPPAPRPPVELNPAPAAPAAPATQPAPSTPAPVSGEAAGGTAVGDPAGAEWADVNRWDEALVREQQVVYQETGVMVPLDRAKAHMMIESGGITGPAVNNVNGDSLGLFQVTSNSYGTYDRERLATDPEYQIYAGLKELALRYQDSNNPDGWDGASRAFFTGSYVDVGRADTTNGTTQAEYEKALDAYMAQIDAAG
ncbi:MAG: hypothetical protein K1X89_31260, partial [Myxococcaceae bacterium]|nr:hypothetical protein [Myxococcaceae bacterium]